MLCDPSSGGAILGLGWGVDGVGTFGISLCSDSSFRSRRAHFRLPQRVHLVVFGLHSCLVCSWDFARFPVLEGLLVVVGKAGSSSGRRQTDSAL